MISVDDCCVVRVTEFSKELYTLSVTLHYRHDIYDASTWKRTATENEGELIESDAATTDSEPTRWRPRWGWTHTEVGDDMSADTAASGQWRPTWKRIARQKWRLLSGWGRTSNRRKNSYRGQHGSVESDWRTWNRKAMEGDQIEKEDGASENRKRWHDTERRCRRSLKIANNCY